MNKHTNYIIKGSNKPIRFGLYLFIAETRKFIYFTAKRAL